MATEKRLIDANELIRFCDNEIDKYKNGLNKHERDYAKAMCVVKKIAQTFPAVDAVEVVRCEKCQYRSQYSNENGMYKCGGILTEDGDCFLMVKPDHFCAFGEHRGKDGW